MQLTFIQIKQTIDNTAQYLPSICMVLTRYMAGTHLLGAHIKSLPVAINVLSLYVQGVYLVHCKY